MSPYWQQPMCIGLISLWIFHPGKSLNYSGCIKHSQRQYSKPFQTLPITIRPYAFWYLVQPLQSFCRNGYNANDCQDTRRQRCQSDVENVRSSQCFWRQNSVNLVFFLFFFFFFLFFENFREFWVLQNDCAKTFDPPLPTQGVDCFVGNCSFVSNFAKTNRSSSSANCSSVWIFCNFQIVFWHDKLSEIIFLIEISNLIPRLCSQLSFSKVVHNMVQNLWSSTRHLVKNVQITALAKQMAAAQRN